MYVCVSVCVCVNCVWKFLESATLMEIGLISTDERQTDQVRVSPWEKFKILHDHAVFALGLLDTTVNCFGVSLSLGGHLALGSSHGNLCATTQKVHVNKFSKSAYQYEPF